MDITRRPVRLERNGALKLDFRVLYHGVPHVANPNPATDIQTFFAFATPGRFLLRARYWDRLSCAGQDAEATTPIQVVAPTGDDLAVWNAIRTCPACAFLLHTADFDPGDAESQAALTLLKDMATRYPASRYSRLIKKVVKQIQNHGKDGDDDDESRDRDKDKD